MKKLIRYIYTLIPLKKYFFDLFLRGNLKVPFQYYQHLHFVGVFNLYFFGNHKIRLKHYGGYSHIIESQLYWEGFDRYIERNSIKIWEKLAEHSSVIFDIGSHTGLYSLIANKANEKAQIFAFEPITRTINKLKKNIELNNCEKSITPIQCAVSNYEGEATLYDLPIENIYSVTVNKNLHSPDLETKEIIVESKTLSTFVKENKIPKIDLLKIDVESHEPEVLEGYKDYLKIHQPTIFVEVWNDEVASRIQKLVDGINYLIFDFDEINGPVQIERIQKSAKHNLLLIKEEMAKKVNLI